MTVDKWRKILLACLEALASPREIMAASRDRKAYFHPHLQSR